MYKNFFGFKERPFKLVPNPAYLFLSKSHEEALAHLSYAVHQGDGFVEITGEVGTGKTTLCRVFLENLSEDTEAAYIFNPKLDAIQLLKSINDEFRIESGFDNTKDLIDALNRFLIEKKEQGKRILLLIDEAQNLSMPVMEQIRLLSNLETTRSKLIQIILVGQPELGEMLDSHELRQLGQRITLSCHLRPFDLKETRDYIQHRIGVAAKRPSVNFTRGAFRVIYRYSRGVPRLINIICDRALLVAFGLDQTKITRRIANRAVQELTAHRNRLSQPFNWLKPAVILLGISVLVLAALLLVRPGEGNKESAQENTEGRAPPSPNASAPVLQTQGGGASPPLSPVPEAKAAETAPGQPAGAEKTANAFTAARIDAKETNDAELPFVRLLETLTPRSRQESMALVAALWSKPFEPAQSLDPLEKNAEFFNHAARQNGFMIRQVQADLEMIDRLNLPAILEVAGPNTEGVRFLALVASDGSRFKLQAKNGGGVALDRETLLKYWTGTAFIPWQDYYHLEGTIPSDAPLESIVALKILMYDIGYRHLTFTSKYDPETEAAIREIQRKHGLQVDGVVGSTTKIVLYNEVSTLKIPHIRETTENRPAAGTAPVKESPS